MLLVLQRSRVNFSWKCFRHLSSYNMFSWESDLKVPVYTADDNNMVGFITTESAPAFLYLEICN